MATACCQCGRFLDALQCGQRCNETWVARAAGWHKVKRATAGTVSNVSLPISGRRRRGRDCNKCRAYATCMCDAGTAGHIQPCASSSAKKVGPSTPATPVGVPVVSPHVGLVSGATRCEPLWTFAGLFSVCFEVHAE